MADNPDERPVVDRVIAELRSGYGGSTGPGKSINGLRLDHTVADGASNTVIGYIAVGYSWEGLHGESGNAETRFDITLEDAQRLAKAIPNYRSNFEQIATYMTTALEKAREDYERDVLGWADAGLPTLSPTTVMKPLRFKRKGFSFRRFF